LTDVAHVTFEVAPLQLAPAVVGAVMYWLRARTLRDRGAPVPSWRQWCWYGGLALMVATLVSPLAHLSEELFLAHMLEHLLLADLGALLLVLGLTGPLLQPLLAAPGLRWLRLLAHPVVALVAWTANFYLWHLPALYQGAVAHDAVHALQHILFVSFGIGMWMALLGPLPKPAWFGNGAKIGYIVAVRLIQSVLANALLWSGAVLYPRYAAGEAYWGITPSNDQSAAGAIMMIEGSFVTIGLFCWLFLRAARESEEKQSLVELAASHGVELSDERAARAVSAGRSEALRERILAERRSREPPGANGGGRL
jgi:cytochrome c oxidase assembly factor CtaG